MVETNFDSASSNACTLHVIFDNRCSNYVLYTSHFLKVLCVHIGTKTCQWKFINFWLCILASVVSSHSWLTGNWIVWREHCLFGSFGLSSWNIIVCGSRWLWSTLASRSFADWSIKQTWWKMWLLLTSCLVVSFDFFITTGPLSELIIDFSTFCNCGLLCTKVVYINSFFIQRHISCVVSLLVSKNIRVELLLALLESINFSTSTVVWLCHTTLSFPVCVGSKTSFITFTIIFDWCFFLISTSEDAWLKLLILLVLSVQAILRVHFFLRRCCVGCLLLGILPITSSTHKCAIPLIWVHSVLLSGSSMKLSCFEIVCSNSWGLFEFSLLFGCLYHAVLWRLIKLFLGFPE